MATIQATASALCIIAMAATALAQDSDAASSAATAVPVGWATSLGPRLETHHEGPSASPFYVPPGPRRVSMPAEVWRGPFRSVQVNTDEFGMNILGDAANEPSIAVDPNNPDRMVIGWRQFDTIESDFRQAGVAYTDDGGQTWTFPGVLTPGVFRSDPVLDADLDGNFYYYNIRCPQSDCGDLFKSTDGGRSWNGPYFAQGGDKPWMVIDRTLSPGRGNIYVAWGGRFIRSRDGGMTFDPSVPASATWGTMVVAPEGTVYMVATAELDTVQVSRSTNAKFPDQTPEVRGFARAPVGGTTSRSPYSPNPGGLLGQPWVALDESDGPHQNGLYVLQSVKKRGDPLDLGFARSLDRGLSWNEIPIQITDDDPDGEAWQWFGTMSVAPATGRIDVIWNDTRNTVDYKLSEVFYAYSTDGGLTWSRNMPVSPVFNSHVGWPRQAKLGDYYHMRSDEKGARLAYAATYNGEQDIYYLHAALDCNGNGFHDGDDIALNRSSDANKNGIPDNCPCDPLQSFEVSCTEERLTARVLSEFPEGTELTLSDNGDPTPIVINERGEGEVFLNRPVLGFHHLDLEDCATWGRTVACPMRCSDIKRLEAKCKNRKLTVKVKSVLPPGTQLRVRMNDGLRFLTIGARGKGKVKREVGMLVYLVYIEECPEFAKTVDCR